jgi:hypothetical protein
MCDVSESWERRDRGVIGETPVPDVPMVPDVPNVPPLRYVQDVKDNCNSEGELPRFENSRNVEMKQTLYVAVRWGDDSILLAGIMLAGLFIYLVQTHSFEELFLSLEVIAIALRKVTKEASRTAIAQGVDQ